MSYTGREQLQRMQLDDATAFTEIYDSLAPELIGFATARLDSFDEARDIIHDIFVHLWQERKTINITTSLRSFLFAAARYRIIDHIRHHSTCRKYAEAINNQPLPSLTTEDELYARELQEVLHNAVESLSPRTREVFKLSRYDHLSVAEIAQKLGTSEQTIKNQLSSALSQLRTRLSQMAFLIWWL